MWRSRLDYVVFIGIALLTICGQYTSTTFLPNPADGIADVIWIFVQGAAVCCVGADAYHFVTRNRRT